MHNRQYKIPPSLLAVVPSLNDAECASLIRAMADISQGKEADRHTSRHPRIISPIQDFIKEKERTDAICAKRAEAARKPRERRHRESIGDFNLGLYREPLTEWLKYKRQRRDRITAMGVARLVARVGKTYGNDLGRLKRDIDFSIERGYPQIYEDRQQKQQTINTKHKFI